MSDLTNYNCSFCAKAAGDVRKLIAGNSSFICDECVELCHGILFEQPAAHWRANAVAELTKLHGDDKCFEGAHVDADQILCDLLTTLGYRDVVEAWDGVGKWYG